MNKQIYLITEFLIKPSQGIVLQTIYYTDGTIEEKEVPKYPIIIHERFSY